MKKTLIRCIVLVHENWKKDILLYLENEKLYVKYVEKYYSKVSTTEVQFGDKTPENVTQAKNYIRNIL